MKTINIVAECLSSLGVEPRGIAQATGIAESNLSKSTRKCVNAPSLGRLFGATDEPTTPYETMLRESTPGYSEEKIELTLRGLTSALKMAEGAEDPQARLAVIVRAVQLAERANVSTTCQESAQALSAWIAGVYLRGIPGGSMKMEVELRVELASVTEQRDEARRQFERAKLSNDCLAEAHEAELRNISAILKAKEGESLEDAAKRAAEERDAPMMVLNMPPVPTQRQVLDAMQKMMKPVAVLPMPNVTVRFAGHLSAESSSPVMKPAVDYLFSIGATRVMGDHEKPLLRVAGLSDEALAEAQGRMPLGIQLVRHPWADEESQTGQEPSTPPLPDTAPPTKTQGAVNGVPVVFYRLPTTNPRDIGKAISYLLGSEPIDGIERKSRQRIEDVRRQLKAMAEAQALCREDQEPAERIAELEVWLRSAEQREKELRANNDGCHAEIARAQSEITRLSEELKAEKNAREAADLKSTMAWATQTEGWAEYQRLRVEIEALIKESKVLHEVPALLPVELLAAVDRMESVMQRVVLTGESVVTVDAMHAEYRRQIESLTTSLKEARAELEKWRKDGLAWLRMRSDVGMVLRRGSGESLPDAAKRAIGELDGNRERLESAASVLEAIAQTLKRKVGEKLTDTAKRVMNQVAAASMLIQDISQKLGRRPDESLADVAQRRMKELSELRGDLRYLDNALGQQDGEDIKRAANRVMAERQEALSRRDTAESALENQHKRIMELGRELDELRARYEDTRKQNEVAGQHLGKQDHEALAHAARRVALTAEAHAQTIIERDHQIEALQVEISELKRGRLIGGDRDLSVIASELGKQQHETLEEAAARVRANAEGRLAVEKELVTVTAEIEKLRSQVEDAKKTMSADFEAQMRVSEGLREQTEALQAERDSLRAEVTMLRDELKTQKHEREEDSKELAVQPTPVNSAQTDGQVGDSLWSESTRKSISMSREETGKEAAELAIDLGQQVKHTISKFVESGRAEANAEVERLQRHKERLEKVCADHAARLRAKFDEVEAIAKALGDHEGQTDEEAARALVAERDQLREVVADLNNQLKSAQLSKLDAATVLGCGETESPNDAVRKVVLERDEIAAEIITLREQLAAEKGGRAAFVASLCAALGVEGGERTVMTAVEQLKENHMRLGERVASAAQVTPANHPQTVGGYVIKVRGQNRGLIGKVEVIKGDSECYQVQLHENGVYKWWEFCACEPCEAPTTPGFDPKGTTEQRQSTPGEVRNFQILPVVEENNRLRSEVNSLKHALQEANTLGARCLEAGYVRHIVSTLDTAKVLAWLLAEGQLRVQRPDGAVCLWSVNECVPCGGPLEVEQLDECKPCDPPAADTPKAEQKKHPEWVRHTKGFNDLKPGTIARVLGVQGDPPDTYKVKRINGPEGSWIMANCEPCEPPAGISPAPATTTAEPTQDEPSAESADGLVIAD